MSATAIFTCPAITTPFCSNLSIRSTSEVSSRARLPDRSRAASSVVSSWGLTPNSPDISVSLLLICIRANPSLSVSSAVRLPDSTRLRACFSRTCLSTSTTVRTSLAIPFSIFFPSPARLILLASSGRSSDVVSCNSGNHPIISEIGNFFRVEPSARLLRLPRESDSVSLCSLQRSDDQIYLQRNELDFANRQGDIPVYHDTLVQNPVKEVNQGKVSSPDFSK